MDNIGRNGSRAPFDVPQQSYGTRLILIYSLWKNEQPYDPTKNLKQVLILNAV